MGDALQGEEEHVVADDQVAQVLHALDLRIETPQEKNQELADVCGVDRLLLQMAQVLFVRHGQALRLPVVDDRLDELSQGRHHQVHPPQMARDAGASFSVGNFKGFKKLDALVGDIGEDPEADDGPDLVQPDLKLRGKLEEVGEQPEEVGLVHGDVAILTRELLQELLNQFAVAVVQKVHRELLQKLGDVLVGGDVVHHGLHPHSVFPTLLQKLLTMLLLFVIRAQLRGDLSPWLNRICPQRLLVFIFVAGGRYVLLVQDLLRHVSKVTVNQALGSFWTLGFLWDSRDVAVVAAGSTNLGILSWRLRSPSRSVWRNKHLIGPTLLVHIFRWLRCPPLHNHLFSLLVLRHVDLVRRLFSAAVPFAAVPSREYLAVYPAAGVFTFWSVR